MSSADYVNKVVAAILDSDIQGGNVALEGGKYRSRNRIPLSRSHRSGGILQAFRRSVSGGSEVVNAGAATAGAEIEGGRRRRHHKMRGGSDEKVVADVSGGRRRRRRSMRGGDASQTIVPVTDTAAPVDISGGRRRRHRRSMRGGEVTAAEGDINGGKRGIEKTIGSRAQVMHGTALKTSGGLGRGDLMKNKSGRIVSRRKSAIAKKRLGAYQYRG